MRGAGQDIIILMVIILIAYTRPVMLVNFFNSTIGRFLLIVAIVLATSVNTLYGLYGVLLLISLREGAKEGLENMDKDDSEEDKEKDENEEDEDKNKNEDEDKDEDEDKEDKKDTKKENDNEMTADDWKKKYCRADKVFLDDKEVLSDEFAKKFPDVKFEKDSCNPCDSSCKFRVSSSKARLDLEDIMKAKPSGSLPAEK
jgi:hypothetical protein